MVRPIRITDIRPVLARALDAPDARHSRNLALRALCRAARLEACELHCVLLAQTRREAVTSPAGTTIMAIRELERHGVRAALLAAIEAARDRSVELGRVDDDRAPGRVSPGA